jgi:hypothetical protein
MIDIDADWNQEQCSLDEHRMNKLSALEQPGFGIHAKQIPDPQPVIADESPVEDKGPDDGE